MGLPEDFHFPEDMPVGRQRELVSPPSRGRRKGTVLDNECLAPSPRPGNMAKIFRASRKRDDLTDSLLHLLAYGYRQTLAGTKRPREKRKVCNLATLHAEEDPSNQESEGNTLEALKG